MEREINGQNIGDLLAIRELSDQEVEKKLQILRRYLRDLHKTWRSFPKELKPPKRISIEVLDDSVPFHTVTPEVHPDICLVFRERFEIENDAAELKVHEQKLAQLAWADTENNTIIVTKVFLLLPEEMQKRILAHEAGELISCEVEDTKPEDYSESDRQRISVILSEVFADEKEGFYSVEDTLIRRTHFSKEVLVKCKDDGRFYPVGVFNTVEPRLIDALQEVFPILFEYITMAKLKFSSKADKKNSRLTKDQRKYMLELAKENGNGALLSVASSLLEMIDYKDLLSIFQNGEMNEAREKALQIYDSLEDKEMYKGIIGAGLGKLFSKIEEMEAFNFLINEINPDDGKICMHHYLIFLLWILELSDLGGTLSENHDFLAQEE